MTLIYLNFILNIRLENASLKHIYYWLHKIFLFFLLLRNNATRDFVFYSRYLLT